MDTRVIPAVLVLGAACGAAVGSNGEPLAPADPPAATAPGALSGQAVVRETYEVVREYPHDATAFTQGLVFHDGYLYEGTGRRGASSLRRVELETGRVVQATELNPALFGEGITILGDRIYQLTWQSGIGIVYDLESFEVVQQFRQFTQGWGLTNDGRELILSDGSAELYFLDPGSLLPTRQIEVRDGLESISQINELEYIDGEIYANVWHSWEIFRISPRDGRVIGRIDMRGILDTDLLPDPESVLNGIAYDPATGRIFVTGKLWPTIFEVRFVRDD